MSVGNARPVLDPHNLALLSVSYLVRGSMCHMGSPAQLTNLKMLGAAWVTVAPQDLLLTLLRRLVAARYSL